PVVKGVQDDGDPEGFTPGAVLASHSNSNCPCSFAGAPLRLWDAHSRACGVISTPLATCSEAPASISSTEDDASSSTFAWLNLVQKVVIPLPATWQRPAAAQTAMDVPPTVLRRSAASR